MCLVDIVQHVWQTGEIPQELDWTFLVLIRKGTTDTRGIGLLDSLWKVVVALIDTRLRSSLQFHDVFHGLRNVTRGEHHGTGDWILDKCL